jgi:hypothetical protein
MPLELLQQAEPKNLFLNGVIQHMQLDAPRTTGLDGAFRLVSHHTIEIRQCGSTKSSLRHGPLPGMFRRRRPGRASDPTVELVYRSACRPLRRSGTGPLRSSVA